MNPLLAIQDVGLSFGGLRAVDGFGLSLMPGDLHALIGPNGAGKTTIFNLITGVYRPDAGTILLEGKRIDRLRPHQIAAAGIARTFQNIRLFSNLSVFDNVRAACHLRTRHSLPAAILRTRRHRVEERAIAERAHTLLAIFKLDDRADEPAGSLPYGDQRKLEIARAIATGPRVLLLDEPAAGTHPGEKRRLAELIRSIRREFNLTILLIEHDMELVMDLCETITVLDYGKVIAVGPPADIQKNPDVIEAYLGEPMKPD